MQIYSNNNDNDSKKWALIGAAWGDILCSISSIYNSQLKNIIYIGAMPPDEVKSFLLCQEKIENVIAINPLKHGMSYNEYLSFWSSMVGRKKDLKLNIEKLFDKLNIQIDYQNIVNCACDIDIKYFKLEQHKDLKLPQNIDTWVLSILNKYDIKKYILVNPFSFNSSPIEAHWKYWDDYLDWLFSYEEITFILIGQDQIFKEKYLKKNNVINLSGLTPSNLHVFGLAQYCDSVITTSNSLSHWCNAVNILCLTMMNLPGCIKYDYFFRILSNENIFKLYFTDSLNYAKHLTTKLNINKFFEKEILKRNFLIEDQLIKEKDRFLYYLTKKFDENLIFEVDNYLEKLPTIALPYSNDEISIKCANNLFYLSQKLNFKNYFEFNCNNPISIISICLGNKIIENVGWNYEHFQSNDNFKPIDEGIVGLNKRYNKNLIYEFIKNKNDSIIFTKYDFFGIDFDIDLETFKTIFANLLVKNVKFIIIYNYHYELNKNKFIKSWTKVFKTKCFMINNFDNIILIDLTKTKEFINDLSMDFDISPQE